MITTISMIIAHHCSIEDPFETHYDVAHVIKSAQMAYLRKELLVSTVIQAVQLVQ